MKGDFVFSWAENAEGKMVHVDDVPRGLDCGCVCPCCHEKLMARHGDVREHGFAHHSDSRRANLEICYMVILYKLAEQIVQTKKRIYAPSYYGIFPEKDIEFIDVKIDGRFEREDKQPDVIATAADGKRYLIEFIFAYKVQHKQVVDYKNLNCLEINLSGQSLESVERFLLEETSDRKWLNSQDYFDNIEFRYQNAGKVVALKDERECESCMLWNSCAGVRIKDSSSFLIIENSGCRYRICKPELYKENLAIYYQRQKEREMHRLRIEQQRFCLERKATVEQKTRCVDTIVKPQEVSRKDEYNAHELDPNKRTCFMCQLNLDWMGIGRYAHCGSPGVMGVPENTPPETAETCKGFMRKVNNKN